jgi:hypothetical protein
MKVPGNEKIAIGMPRGSDTKFSYHFITSVRYLMAICSNKK